MATRAQLIQNKIDLLKQDLEKLNLPKEYAAFLNSDMDLCDIVYLLSMTFHPINDLPQIESIIVKNILSQGLEVNQNAVQLIKEFIVWFKKLT